MYNTISNLEQPCILLCLANSKVEDDLQRLQGHEVPTQEQISTFQKQEKEIASLTESMYGSRVIMGKDLV